MKISLLITTLCFNVLNLCTGEPCTTPKGENGNCISVYNCTELLRALVTFNTAEIEYVKKLQCGYNKNGPLVCCAIKKPTTNTNNDQKQDLLMNKKYCGYQHFDDYFVQNRGLRASIDEFPWLANLMFLTDDSNITILCSGSLINERYVLTAAHCVKTPFYTLVGVRLGEHNLKLDKDCTENAEMEECSDPVMEYGVEEIIMHPDYSLRTKSSDIALLKLNQTVIYSDFIRPICLPFPGTILAKVGEVLTLSGWGRSSSLGERVDIKKRVLVELRPMEECQRAFGNFRINVTNKQTCTLEKSNNLEFSCQGDSGGPVIFANRNQWHVEGVLSFGRSCGAGALVVNTNVASYLDWIVEKIRV